MWDWIIQNIDQMWGAVRSAPIPVFILCLAFGVIVFGLQEWRYEGVRDRLEARDEEIDRLKQKRSDEGRSREEVPRPTRYPDDYPPIGTPDAKLVPVFNYVRQSAWAEVHNASGTAVLIEIRDKLQLRQLSAWGRKSPAGAVVHILPSAWEDLRLNPGNGGAQKGGTLVWHDVQFDMKSVRATWQRRSERI